MYTNLFFDSEREASFRKFPVCHAYSLRLIGNMADTYEKRKGAAAENRRYFLNETGFRDHKIVRMIPQHESKIVSVNSRDGGREIKCDGLFTIDPKVALAVCVGDCSPVIITTRRREFLMLLHVGVQGASDGIIDRAVKYLWHRYTIPPDRLVVGIGPGICANCYDAEWVIEKFGTSASWEKFLPWQEPHKKRHCDLRGYIADRLLARNVRKGHISIARECTCCSRYPDRSYLFASHHRAKTSGPEERFLAVAALARPPFSLRRVFGRSFFTAQS